MAKSEQESRRQFLKEFCATLGVLMINPLSLLRGLARTEEFFNLQHFAQAESWTKDVEWELFHPGDQVFAMAKGQVTLRSHPEIDAAIFPNRIVNIYPADTDNILYSPRHMMEFGTTLRLKKIDSEWAQILRHKGYTPFKGLDTEGDEPEELYVELKDFEPILQLKPINVIEDTKPIDKEIVMVRTPSPHLLLIEGNVIVACIPVIIGSYKTPTPNGNYFAEEAALSTFMPDFPGVGFCLKVLQLKVDAIWIHQAAWWKWFNIKKGRTGSHGCINAPDSTFQLASIAGKDVSMAQFIFQWALTNFPQYDQKAVESVLMDRKVVAPLPVRVVDGIAALKNTKMKRANSELNWDSVLTQWHELWQEQPVPSQWIIPHVK